MGDAEQDCLARYWKASGREGIGVKKSKKLLINVLIECADILPPLWSNGQSSWLQIQRSGFDSWRYQILTAFVV
jgi:hypothetical protein